MTKIPKKFVGLHNHTTQGSPGDAIGTPFDHLSFAMKNGLSAHAITDHGNMNSYSFAYHASKNLGGGIKYIPGIEAYFHPNLSEWSDYKQKLADEKAAAKEKEQQNQESAYRTAEMPSALGDEFANTTKDLVETLSDNGHKVVSDDSSDNEGGTIVENEEESKGGPVRDPLKRRHHLVLLAKNSEGLKSLFKITSRSFIEGFYRFPRIDFNILKQEAKGNIIASQACVAGMLADIVFKHQTEPDWKKFAPSQENFEKIQAEIKEAIEKFKWALGDENFYLELQWNNLGAQHLANYHFIEASKRTNTPLIVTVDAHYSDPSHWKERELYKMMAWMSKTKEDASLEKIPKSMDDLKCELYPKNVEQVWESYKKYSKGYDFYDDDLICDAIERTWTIAHEQIENPEIDRKVKLPAITKLIPTENIDAHKSKSGNVELSEDDIAYKELLRLCKQKLIARNLHEKKDYIARLHTELDDIKVIGWAKYFLTYAKIMELTTSELFVGSGRGSVGGSLIAYLLGISQVDPIRWGTLWERFGSKFKKGVADIDNDWSDRDKAVKLIAEYFGDENVIPVSNFSQLQVASLIKDLAKIFGVPFEEVNKYTAKMRSEALAVAKARPGFDAGVWQFTVEDAEKDSPSFREFMEKMKKYPDFEVALKILFKQVRNVSRHAGGVLITENAPGNMPLIKAKGGLQTPWPEGVNARHLEEFGFLKFDILGLGTLRMFENCVRKILKKQGNKHPTFSQIKEWFDANLHPDNNAYDDINVYKNVFWSNRFAGIFQFIDPKVQNYAALVKPTSVFDLADITSLFRPGPMGVGSHNRYLETRTEGKTTYLHPLLKEVFGPNRDTIIYQEDLQLIYHKLAGVPLAETDSIRKAFTKKEISNKEKAKAEQKRLRDDFTKRCKSVNGIEEHVSARIFDDIDMCAAYLFNKAHAISYSINSYCCAWLFTYYPDEWITTYIDYCSTDKGKVSGQEDPKAVAIKEAKALGFRFGKPDINLSEHEYTIQGNLLIPSFASLKHVGTTVVREINDYRPYKSLEDLLWTKNSLHTIWRHSKFNKRALATLVKMEAFDSMGLVGPGKTFQNYRQMYEVMVEKGDQIKKALARKKNRNHEELLKQFIEEVQTLPDWTPEEKLRFQLELGGSVDLSLIMTPGIEQFLNDNDISPIELWESENSAYWAIVQNCTLATARTGRKYMKVALMGSNGSTHMCSIWSYGGSAEENEKLQKNTVITSVFQKNEYGLSTNIRKIYKVRED
jgi:DNA-directed DNA polymerase III PolC